MSTHDPVRATVYVPAVLAQVPRLLSCLDRESHSTSYGSLDREHWGWKFRDFPITMSQIAMCPLALLWRHPFAGNPYYQNPRLASWIAASVESTLHRQHTNGAFDSVGPWTQDHGASLFLAYGLTETCRLLGTALPSEVQNAMAACVDRACRFALRSREDYAFISNHQALFALTFYYAYEFLGYPDFRQRADEVVAEILRHQSAEGWFQEYEGPDPGYESLGIFYLAKLWQRSQSEKLLAALERAVHFYAYCVHPDGSLGGVYGSRHTALYFPGGFEILSTKIPMATSIASFLRARLVTGNVVTPSVSDIENLPVLAHTYLEGCLVPPAAPHGPAPTLPWEQLDGVQRFPQSGVVVAGNRRYYAVCNSRKGGVCRIFDKTMGRIAYEDAGYFIRAGARRYTSQMIGMSTGTKTSDPRQIVAEGYMGQVRQELLTPLKFLLLRVLNLTVFRSLTLGAWVRRRILNRLILSKQRGPLRLSRSIRFDDEEIRFSDEISMTQPGQVDELDLPRSFMAIHMGSAKYFHPAELETTPLPSVTHLREQLNRHRKARHEFVLRFHPASPAVIIAGSASASQPTEKIAL